MKKNLILAAIASAMTVVSACQVDVPDENENVYAMLLSADPVYEGDDLPISVTLNAAGLRIDNEGWGDPWKGATFSAVVKDAFGRSIDNVVWSGPTGLIKDGTKMDLPENGKVDLVVSGLRKGGYTVMINLETRYAVDTWASCSVNVKDASGKKTERDILVDSFTLPDETTGIEVDDNGNIILDLRFFNENRPFYYESIITPVNATNKQLIAESTSDAICGVRIDGTRTFVLTPRAVGVCRIDARSEDGNAKAVLSVKVIQTQPEANGFTLPTDPNGGDAMALFDAGGRLALDINSYPNGAYYEYVCVPLPSGSVTPTLSAESNNPEIARATIVNGNTLRIYPAGVGYAVITVSKNDGSFSRNLGVAVISKGEIIIDVEEGEPTLEDGKAGVFPCKLVFSSSTQYYPSVMVFDVYGKVSFRADLTDPADSFVDEAIKNSRTAFADYEENLSVLFIPGVSVYNIYERMMSAVAGTRFLVHHTDDWPNNRDYYLYATLYKLYLKFSIRKNYDTNLYRFEIVDNYNKPENRIYQYL